MNNERLFVVSLLWVHDPDMFAEYQEQSKPVLAKQGVHIERWLMTETMEGNGFDRPDQMVVTWHRKASQCRGPGRFRERPGVQGSSEDSGQGGETRDRHRPIDIW